MFYKKQYWVKKGQNRAFPFEIRARIVANVDFADDCDTVVFRSADFGRSDNTKHGRYLYIP